MRPGSAEELHRSGQRTPLDLAVEMLRHVSVMACAASCRYCVNVDLFDADVRWLVEREDARVVALARACEIEAALMDRRATDDEREEYRTLKASGLLGPSDEVEILLRAVRECEQARVGPSTRFEPVSPDGVQRLAVPGGWLYRTTTSLGVAMTFVPEPQAAPVAADVDKRRGCRCFAEKMYRGDIDAKQCSACGELTDAKTGERLRDECQHRLVTRGPR